MPVGCLIGRTAAPGKEVITYAEHVTVRIGDVELRDQHAGVLQLRGLEKLYGMPMAGLLGYDFLSRFVVDIDYARRLAGNALEVVIPYEGMMAEV